MKLKRSQYAFEFIVVFAILTLIFMFWLQSYFEIKQDIRKTGRDSIIQTYGANLAESLYLAAQVNPGYSDEIIVRDNIQGMQFDEIYLEKGSLVIAANNKNYYFDIPCLYVVKDTLTTNCGFDVNKLDIKDQTILIENIDFELFLNIPGCEYCDENNPGYCEKLC